MLHYDVIIVGGGPTGVALGIELGLQNINTLILEKYAHPLFIPRAQLINARSMEFFMRWGLDDALKAKQILSSDFPNRSIWCSSLNGTTYAINNSNEQLNDRLSSQLNIRVPLWITEEVLRNKLQEFSCVNFLTQYEVVDINFNKDTIIVVSKNVDSQITYFNADYVIGCDGTNSITRSKAGIHYRALAPLKRAISVVFEVSEFENYITVSKGCLFFLLNNTLPAAIGSIDPQRGLWYAQIIYEGTARTIQEINIDILINEISGITFPKKIMAAHFWDMHIQLAENFTYDNRVFLVGDSAHGFVPTGALGLNTGFGDVINLAWKLKQVIRKEAQSTLLSTYEQERLPVCLNNLKIAQKNADEMGQLRKKYDPNIYSEEFSKANCELAKQFSNSLGVTMGYAYFDSPLTQLQIHQSILPMPKECYIPTAKPGYFLPHIYINSKESIYNALSPTDWTLIISGQIDLKSLKSWKEKFTQCVSKLECLYLNENSYPSKYILIRPDWHITLASDELNYAYFESDIFMSLEKRLRSVT